MRIDLPSGTPAELVRPAGEPSVGLVIAPDIFGLRPLFSDMAEHLATRQGYVVCVPEPFPGRELGPDVEVRQETMRTLSDAQQLHDLELAADATGCERVGLIGFCMGGMYALKSAVEDRFTKCVSFYGMVRVPKQWKSKTQADPIDILAERGAAHCMEIVGTEDPYVPVQDAKDLEALGATVVIVKGAEHGFIHDPDRPAHRPKDAKDAWARAKKFLGL